MKQLFLILIILIVATSCSEKEKQKDPIIITPTAEVNPEKASQILTTTCYTCHSPSASEDARLAPPMEAIKRRYMMTYSNEKEFVEAITTFTVNPNEEASLMRGAVDRFGVMPIQSFKEEDMRAVATYIYQNELPQPAWFEDHFNQMHPDSGMKMRMRKQHMMD